MTDLTPKEFLLIKITISYSSRSEVWETTKSAKAFWTAVESVKIFLVRSFFKFEKSGYQLTLGQVNKAHDTVS